MALPTPCIKDPPKEWGNIPQELKDRPQWVVWKFVYKAGQPKPSKVPYNPKTGKEAKANNPNTWGTYEQAIEAYRKGNYDGLGYEFSKDDDKTGIDLDDCVENGVILPWAKKIIDRLNSYMEFSISGSGIKCIIDASKPGSSCRKGKVEIYEHSRYFALTGNLVPGYPATIENRQDELDRLYAEIFNKPSSSKKSIGQLEEFDILGKLQPSSVVPIGGATPDNLSDTELLNKAMDAKDGAKFKALWNGDTSEYGNDDSSADLALCCLLAYWTRKDPARMDSLFRQSGLMRDKWNRRTGDQTYGDMTISKAVEGTSKVYEGKAYGKRNRLHSVKSSSSPEQNGLTSIIVNNRQLLEMASDALKALVEKNSNDENSLYVRSGSLVTIRADEKGVPRIQFVTETILRGQLSRTANFFKIKKTEEGANYTAVIPPLEISQNILSDKRYPFPPIVAIIEAPVLRPDGSILDKPGHDKETGLYYKPAQGLTIPPVPSKPTAQDVMKAKETILEIFEEFNFKDAGSKAGASALLLTPIIRNAISPACTPLFLIDAPSAGSGKTLIAKVCSLINTGEAGHLTTLPFREEEVKKLISTLLIEGEIIAIIDNVEHPIFSGSLSAVLTTTGWKDRRLGTLDTVTVPNLTTWIMTGNNIRVRGDIARRCVWIRIDPDAPKPWKRNGFKHPNLLGWVRDNRGPLLCSLLTLARAWWVAGCPKADIPTLGNFEEWTEAVGGILAFSGIDGLLSNLDEFTDSQDEEAVEWSAFFSTWLELFKEEPTSTGDFLKSIGKFGTLPEDFEKTISNEGRHNSMKVAKLFEKHKDVVYQVDGKNLRFEKGVRDRTNVTRWFIRAR